MPATVLADRATELAVLLLDLTPEALASTEGRAQLAEALHTTLALVETAERGRACADCALARPGVHRAIANLAELLAQAGEHADFLCAVTRRPPEPAIWPDRPPVPLQASRWWTEAPAVIAAGRNPPG